MRVVDRVRAFDLRVKRAAPLAVALLLAALMLLWLALPDLTDRIAGSSFANAPMAYDLEARSSITDREQ